MRILVVESHIGESDELISEAEEQGHEVVRCQPVDETVLPCVGIDGDSDCPFDGRVDVAIDVHPGPRGFAPREIGLLCAEQAGIPLVVAGASPLGASATETTAAGALPAAERLARDADDRLPEYAVERAVRRELESIGRGGEPVDVTYEDHDGVFDVVVAGVELGPIEQAALDAAVLPLFAEAMRRQRFGDTIYRRHGRP